MKKIFFIFLFAILSIGIVNAGEICIDLDKPSTVGTITLTDNPDSDGNVQLTWTAATDEPDCSGIDYYNIYRGSVSGFTMNDSNKIYSTNELSYSDNGLAEGKYYYKITAVDLAGNVGPEATATLTVSFSSPSTGGGSSGGGGGSSGGGKKLSAPTNGDTGTTDTDTGDVNGNEEASSGIGNEEETIGTTGITGGVIANLFSSPGNIAIILSLFVLAFVIYLFVYKNKKKNKKKTIIKNIKRIKKR